MTKVVTPYMLQKKFAEVTQQNKVFIKQQASNPNNTLVPEENSESNIQLILKNIVKVQDNFLISEDNEKIKLFNSYPCLSWTCTSDPSTRGIIVLEKKLKALCITDGTNTYALGVEGDTSEFMLKYEADKTDVQLHKEYVSVKTTHILKNGVEEKTE